MDVPTRTVEYEDERVTAVIEVRQASVRDGMRRTRLMQQAEEMEFEEDEMRLLRTLVYPPLVSVSEGSLTIAGEEQDWPPDFDTYVELPEALGMQWENAVFDLNPHFWPRGAGEDSGEKKA